MCFLFVQVVTECVSEDGVNQSTCWAGGEEQLCNGFHPALQSEHVGSTAIVLNQLMNYTITSETFCSYKDDVTLELHEDCPTWSRRGIDSIQCECGVNYMGILRCYNPTIQVSIFSGYCMTLDGNTTTSYGMMPEQVLVGACMYFNCYADSSLDPMYSSYHFLPQSPRNLNDATCKCYNRCGRLCAECMEGYHQPVYSYDMKCLECSISNYNVILYILLAFGPLTVFLVFMLTCKVNVAAPPLSALIQLMQLLSSPISLRAIFAAGGADLHHKIWMPAVKFLATIYGVWNLDFFRTVIPPICLDISTLQALSLDYIIAVYPLTLTVAIYILIELHARNVRVIVWLWRPLHKHIFLCRRQWNIKSSIAGTFASFILLSYMKFATVSFDLLFPVRVYNMDGEVRMYLYYDATIGYFSPAHLPYAFLAILVSIIFLLLPIIFLISYPYPLFCKCICTLRLQSCFIDDIVNEFHNSYKDGKEGTGNINGLQPLTSSCDVFC